MLCDLKGEHNLDKQNHKIKEYWDREWPWILTIPALLILFPIISLVNKGIVREGGPPISKIAMFVIYLIAVLVARKVFL